SSSTKTESGCSCSITSLTCSALRFETCAVPINTISFSFIKRRVIFSVDIRFSSFIHLNVSTLLYMITMMLKTLRLLCQFFYVLTLFLQYFLRGEKYLTLYLNPDRSHVLIIRNHDDIND